MKNYFFILFFLFSYIGYTQEICDNGLDDDADGLIDLMDTLDCKCVLNDTAVQLIQNPSFDDTSCCPMNLTGQMNCSQHWQNPSWSTPDYFNLTCNPWVLGAPLIPPPLPFPSGTSCVGLYYSLYQGPSTNNTANYKEYVSQCLSNKLVAGKTYVLEFYMAQGRGSLSTSFTLFGTSNCSNIPFGGTNFYFGCPTNGPNWMSLAVDSTIVLASGVWTKIIVNFIPPVDIWGIAFGPSCKNLQSINYYYLDEFGIKEDKVTVHISDSGHICRNNLTLRANYNSKPNSIQWYKDSIALVNDTNLFYNVPNGGIGSYQVRLVYDSFCIISNKFQVDSSAIDYDFATTGSCLFNSNNGQIFITNTRNGIPPYRYRLNGGSYQLDSSFRNLRPGLHLIEVEDSNTCSLIKTIQIDTFAKPVANFTSDSVCLGQKTNYFDLSTIQNGNIIEWNWGLPGNPTTQNTTFTHSIDGVFPVNLSVKSDSGCFHDTILNVIVYSLPIPNFTYSPRELFTFDTRVCFTNVSSGAITYLWNFDFAGTSGTSTLSDPCTVSFPNDKSKTYKVKLYAMNDFGCMDSIEYNVIILDGLFLFIPNSFSPDEDGINDKFSVRAEGIDDFVFIIFDRWGEEIYKTTDLEFSWDGNYKGSLVQIGSYPYCVKVKTRNGFVSEKRGHINVVR